QPPPVSPPPPPPPHPEAAPEAPPMLQAQRLQPQPVQRKQVQPAPRPPDISQPVEMPKVDTQPPPQQPPPQPLKRRILTDNRATDTLKARDLTKVASRSTSAPTTTTKVEEPPSMFIPGFSTVAALEGAAQRHIVRASLPATAPGRSRRTLQAARGEAQAVTSVGVVRSIHPRYPRIAKKSGWEGTVLVRVTVEKNGRASKVVVSRSSGRKVLDDAAVKAVRRWGFRPARDGNIPIQSVVVIPIKFSLSKQG
ncbi:MAG: energy transducer TonB, partial [Nitrospira sp.]|nr:energy transducer TonB [Nitrospira sp.]